MANLKIAPSRYTLKEGRTHGRIDNAMRVIAASDVLRGMSVQQVAKMYNVNVDSIRNWVKTLYKNNPNLG